MKYSTLFTILSIAMLVFPWTGLPFGFIRLIISLCSIILFFFSLGLYQKEQKIAEFIREIKNTRNTETYSPEPEVSQREVIEEIHKLPRKKLTDISA
jgi:hypothetical protein